MHGEHNRKHNRKITRSCPVCGSRVIVGNRNGLWWVTCEADHKHIPQIFYQEAADAIRCWNNPTNINYLRYLTAYELAKFLCFVHEVACTKEEWIEFLLKERD